MVITKVTTRDLRFPLADGAGVDSVHSNPVYSYAVTDLATDNGMTATGIAFTLGGGNELVCSAIEQLSQHLVGKDIDELMAAFGSELDSMMNHPQWRWLGPHKGVVQLALASVVNACFDLWAKHQQKPLWRLLIDLEPEQIVNLLVFAGVEDVLDRAGALEMLRENRKARDERLEGLRCGYPGYDTSAGWINYDDDRIVENSRRAVADGFGAIKLKVGSDDPQRDIRRLYRLREVLGDDVKIMLDANQKWSLAEALDICDDFRGMHPYWIEEPLHPDDVVGHRNLQNAVSPLSIALGEHVPNAVLFKNFMQLDAMRFCQVDCVRVAGVSEFILVSLLARKFDMKVVPHVGDMGQIHQHLVVFNHVALGHDKSFLEHIPHLREYFLHPASLADGFYQLPQEAGAGCDFKSHL